jgi:hypothetical protein
MHIIEKRKLKGGYGKVRKVKAIPVQAEEGHGVVRG